MNLCDYINEFKSDYGNMAHKYARMSTFGNNTEEAFYKLAAVNAMIKTLERQVTGTRTTRVKFPAQGQTVPFSSLKSSNNILYLDSIKHYKCETTDIRPCLSEEQICSILEKLTLICKNN